jgi:hypothetical protein
VERHENLRLPVLRDGHASSEAEHGDRNGRHGHRAVLRLDVKHERAEPDGDQRGREIHKQKVRKKNGPYGGRPGDAGQRLPGFNQRCRKEK